MQVFDAVGMLEIPQLRRVAGLQPRLEQIGPGSPVGQEPGAEVEEALKAVGHGANLMWTEYEILGCPARWCKAKWRSEEHTSELQSLMRISYAVFCLKKQKTTIINL